MTIEFRKIHIKSARKTASRQSREGKAFGKPARVIHPFRQSFIAAVIA
ncbi:MAG: hypothetical protein PHH11_09225 [Methylomonas sp.]|nr:hypothetical protein [Methylomonas sp.]